MTKAPAQQGRRAHLPEQPGQALGACGGIGGDKFAKLLREIEQDSAGFKDARRLGRAVIHQCRNFGIGVDADKAAAEL